MDRLTDRLIVGIANRIRYGLSKKEIADEFASTYTQEQIFLAYAAALILLKDH